MITNAEGGLPPLLFVHIPKTAGMTLRAHLNAMGQDKWNKPWLKLHCPYHVIKQHNDIGPDVFKFAVVRNPFTRTYSYFRFLTRFFDWNINFNEWLNVSEYDNKMTEITSLSAYDQSFYIFHNGKTEMDKIYRYENMKELEEDLNISMEVKINVGIYTKEEYYKDYTPSVIDRVRKICARDFELLGYSDEFS